MKIGMISQCVPLAERRFDLQRDDPPEFITDFQNLRHFPIIRKDIHYETGQNRATERKRCAPAGKRLTFRQTNEGESDYEQQ